MLHLVAEEIADRDKASCTVSRALGGPDRLAVSGERGRQGR